MNPIARLIGQAEAELGGATRRLVDSVTDPVRVKGHVLAAEASAAVSRIVRDVVIKGAFGIVAAAMAIVALVYFAAALQQALLPHFGPVETRVIMAVVFLLVAGLAGLLMAFWPTGDHPNPPSDVAADVKRTLAESKTVVSEKVDVAQSQTARVKAEADASADTASAASTMSGLRSGVESLAGVLGAAGFRREQAGLRAGMLLANQLKPIQLVSLALIGGFLAGMRSRRR